MTAKMRASLPRGKAARMKVDVTAWWNPELEDDELRATMREIYADVGRGALMNVADTVDRIIPKGISQSVIGDLLEYGGQRIKEINERTLQALTVELAEGTRRGYSITQLIEGVPDENYRGVMQAGLDNGVAAWSELRAETIARTETMLSYNRATVTGYREFGVTHLLAYDGDQDPECAERNGHAFTVDEAEAIEDHPNGTLVWSPVVTDEDIAAAEADVAERLGEGEAPTDEGARIREQEAAEIAANRERNDAAVAAQEQQLVAAQEQRPVSSAFDSVIAQIENSSLAMRDPQYVKVLDKIKSALSTIDRTFTDGQLPKMPKIGPIKGGKRGLNGKYTHGYDNRPMSLEFRSNAHMETVFHEITHFIDHLGIGSDGFYGSKLGLARLQGRLDQFLGVTRAPGVITRDPTLLNLEARAKIMEPVMRAITESDGWRSLSTALKTRELNYTSQSLESAVMRVDQHTARWISYATDPQESFARAMAQYLSMRAGPQAIADLESRIYLTSTRGEYVVDVVGNRVLAPLADQWTASDFAAIDRAITQMLSDLGWAK